MPRRQPSTGDLATLAGFSLRTIPGPASIQANFDPQSSSECTQVDGVAIVNTGSAVCTTTDNTGTKASAQAEGTANATANAVHTGNANAQAQGDGSAATAQAGAASRAGQAGNTARAVSTGGSATSADSGQGDYDQGNTVTAVGDGGSQATGTVDGGKNNTVFSGSVRDGASDAAVTAGDDNHAVALGADGNNAPGCGGLTLPGSASGCGALATALIGVAQHRRLARRRVELHRRHQRGLRKRPQRRRRRRPGLPRPGRLGAGQRKQVVRDLDRPGPGTGVQQLRRQHARRREIDGRRIDRLCNPIGEAVNSGETTYPLDACAAAESRAASGDSNTAITIVDKAKAFSDAEMGTDNTAVTIASNGGNIIWNTTASLPGQPANPDAGKTASCPWALPPPPQAQQACGNATR